MYYIIIVVVASSWKTDYNDNHRRRRKQKQCKIARADCRAEFGYCLLVITNRVPLLATIVRYSHL